MRRSVGDRIRAAARAAVPELGGSVTPAKLEERIKAREPAVYADWRRAIPEPGARLAYLGELLAPGRPRRAATGRRDGDLFLWPIGSRQRWNLLAAHGSEVGPPPDPSENRFYLHNYGTSDVVDVSVYLAGLWQEYIPRVAAGEPVEIGWSEERIHPSEPGIPPSEERGYPDPFNPSGDRLESHCALRIEFTAGGLRRMLEGTLYFWAGAPPTFFQRTGPAEAADHAREIR